MGGDPEKVGVGDYCRYKILNMSTAGVCDKMYYISRFTSQEKIAIEKQIRANRKNPIILFPTDQLTDNLALELFEEECPYVLFEVSVLGISSIFNIVNYGSCTYKEIFGYRLQQQSIPPEFVNPIEIRNTSDRKNYEDFNANEKEIELEKQKEKARNEIRNSFKWDKNEWLNLEMGIEKFIEENKYIFHKNEVILRKVLNEEFEKWYKGLDPIVRKEFEVRRSTKRFDL